MIPLYRFLICLLSLSPDFAFAAADALEEQTLQIPSERSEELLKLVIADPRAVFLRYRPALDSGSKLVKPVRISGSKESPVMQLSIRKCVAILCQTVDLDATISVREISGNCDLNFHLVADLTRSSATVSDIYDRLDVALCFRAQRSGSGSLAIGASAHHGPQYARGFVQGEMFKLLKLQVPPIVKAFQEVLKEKENK